MPFPPEPRYRIQSARRALECGALFLGVPAVIAAGWLPVLVIPLLLLMAVGCGLTLQYRHKIHLRDLLQPKVPRAEWRRILLLHLIALPCLTALLWAIQPAAMFSLVCRHTGIWLFVMFAYPLVSVLPQELIYRAFFFERYRPLFGRGIGMTLASAAVFGFGHVVFHNWPAVILTCAGGGLFATTYQRTSSLLLVSVEHALYGCAIFTIGYGQFFFDGTLRLFR
jgi:membrane protease YdiL (CAAX protease family)